MQPRIQLVKMSVRHLENTRKWLQSPKLRQQIDTLKAPSPAENKTYWRRNWADRSRLDFAILDDEEHIGNCGLSHIDPVRRKAELWIYVGGKKRKGLGSLALTALLILAFKKLKLNRIYLRVVATNSGAKKFYIKHGFKVEGRLRKDTISGRRSIDSFILSLLDTEFGRNTK